LADTVVEELKVGGLELFRRPTFLVSYSDGHLDEIRGDANWFLCERENAGERQDKPRHRQISYFPAQK
jgi:hypothetical protein